MGRRITAGNIRKDPKMSQVLSSPAVYLLSKELRLEHGGAKFASSPGRHLYSLRPCKEGKYSSLAECPLHN